MSFSTTKNDANKKSLFLLIISSKNKKSINNFLNFFFKHIKTQKILTILFAQKKIVKKLTILKSPHVNKTAQEQFESRKFTKKILLNSSDIKHHIILIKKILIKTFQDLKLIIKIKQKKYQITNFKIFNSYNFKFTNLINKNFNYKLKKNKTNLKNIFLKQHNNLFYLSNFLKTICIRNETFRFR